MVSDNPGQVARIAIIKKHFKTWELHVRETIASGFRQTDLAVMNAIRNDFKDFISEEEALRTQRISEALSSSHLVLASAGGLAILLSLILAFIERRWFVKLSKTHENLLKNVSESREWFSTTLTSIGDAVIAVDTSGRASFMNSIAEKMTGWPLASAEHHPLSEIFNIVNQQTRQPAENSVSQVLQQGTIVGPANHTVLISRSGREYAIENSAAPIRNISNNQTAGVVLVFRDITEKYAIEENTRKYLSQIEAQAAELQKSFDARDEFLSIASHELKTPITSLSLQIQMVQRSIATQQGLTISSEKLAKSLETSKRQVERLTALVEDLLDISRMAAGKLSYVFDSVDLTALVKEMFDRFSAQMKAMKYGAGKPIHISVMPGECGVCIQVRDNGIGIEKSFQKKIFGRYERAATQNNIGGLGLGLFITHQIIQAHGGSITVESEAGRGSVFSMFLPERPPSLDTGHVA